MRYSDYPDIKVYQAKLSSCSLDGENNETMTDSDLRVINFDNVKTAYLNQNNFTEEKAHSVDALANGSDQLTYLIEFKNGRIQDEKRKLNLKIRDSILILCDICNCHIRDTRNDVVFVLVYNEEKANLPWETKRCINSMTLSGKPVLFADFDKVEGFLVKKVFMLSQQKFENQLLPKLVEV